MPQTQRPVPLLWRKKILLSNPDFKNGDGTNPIFIELINETLDSLHPLLQLHASVVFFY